MIDRLLNKISMYRLVVYTLSALAAISVVLALLGRLPSSPTVLVVSLSLLISSAYVTDRSFGRLFHVPTNRESALITALILFLIVQPAHSPADAVALVAAGAVSSASKFLVTWRGKHLFNPAAFAAALLSITGLQATTWWVGSSLFWPWSLVLGLAVVRKVRRFSLFFAFVAVAIAFQLALVLHSHQPIGIAMKHALLASPLIFLSTIMLTEPATMPPRRNLQLVFGALVAALYVGAWKIGPLTLYPEVALLAGNLFAFAVSPKSRIRLKLLEAQKISDRMYNYVFQPDRPLRFLPGQYMEWTLPGVAYDSRGNRRTFTIASSPTEPTVQLGVKYYEPASMYKARLLALKPGDVVYGSQLAGNFTLQGNERKKLAFIAGGIGITPFRSMIKYLTDKHTQADIVLVYVVSTPQEFAYVPELEAAKGIGLRIVPVVTRPGRHLPNAVNASVSADLLAWAVPDYAERLFYISGPNAMVDAAKGFLQALHVPRTRIKTDHFSGY
ncbi:MAG TPA: hypothetical protein VLF91_02860 [Candidatus Saccharimonadales bacterium]|nr:hypothetical protein [Candidatus Saccharimonadales bacterium]